MKGTTVLNISHHRRIIIGFAYSSFPLDHHPGWTADSWGYHGDDRMCYHNSNKHLYGPTFKTGDVIGCCLDFGNGQVFYTLNGKNLGVAFCPEWSVNPYEKQLIFPCIGLHSVGERIRINLGKERFVFNILEYVKGGSR
jgi:hypothetical protein